MDQQQPRNSVVIKELSKKINLLLTGVPYHVYSRAQGINNSGLQQLLRSPQHYRHWQKAPENDASPALVLGKATHVCVLEPESFAARVKVLPATARRGIAAKQQLAELRAEAGEETIVVNQAQYDAAQRMRDAVWRNISAAKALSKGFAEASLWWSEPEYDNQLCKARVDFVSTVHAKGLVVDLKTTRDASRVKFSRSVIDYRYDMQAAHYLAGGRASGAFDDQNYLFLVVESEPPHACCVYTLSDALLGVGIKWREEAMERYRDALKSNDWPSIPQVDRLGAPPWARVPGEEDEILL